MPLIRGRAALDVVDGIPAEYLQMNGSYQMTPEQRVETDAVENPSAAPSQQ